MDKKEQARIRKQRQRDRERGDSVTSNSVTPQSVTLLPRPNGEDYDPNELLPDGSKRYLGPFSDGQVLDRLTVSEPGYLPGMAACNRADKTDLSKGMSKQRRLAMLICSLDKNVGGLDGKKVNLLSMVRYGINGMTLEEIKGKL